MRVAHSHLIQKRKTTTQFKWHQAQCTKGVVFSVSDCTLVLSRQTKNSNNNNTNTKHNHSNPSTHWVSVRNQFNRVLEKRLLWNQHPSNQWQSKLWCPGQCVPSVSNNAGSCGTHIAMWSNDSMPEQVGVISSIQFYASWTGNCKYLTKPGQVMKCSDKPYDYVYRYCSSYTGCYVGFCGMD